jgi:flagellar protein FlgJ
VTDTLSPTSPAAAPAVAATAATSAPDTSRLSTAANLKAAGDKFEAIFINMMLKSMRQAKLADGLFDSSASDTFRDMQDQQLAESMAAHAPLGIGKAVTDFLTKSRAGSQISADPAVS